MTWALVRQAGLAELAQVKERARREPHDAALRNEAAQARHELQQTRASLAGAAVHVPSTDPCDATSQLGIASVAALISRGVTDSWLSTMHPGRFQLV